jgi:hypothetical protein
VIAQGQRLSFFDYGKIGYKFVNYVNFPNPMKKTICLATVLMGTFLAIAPTQTIAQTMIAQDPPAKTYQPGFWQPTARVVVNRPIVIEVKNNTDELIDYNLTTNQVASPVKIEPGKSSSIKDFQLPAYLLINFSSATVDSSQFVLKYEVSVDEKTNTLTVKVNKAGGEVPGNRTLNISETGAIYLY